MTPALAAAIAGKTQSPLSRLRNASISAANSPNINGIGQSQSPFADPDNLVSGGEYEMQENLTGNGNNIRRYSANRQEGYGAGGGNGRDTIGDIFGNYGGEGDLDQNYRNEDEDPYGGTVMEDERDEGRTRVLYGGSGNGTQSSRMDCEYF